MHERSYCSNHLRHTRENLTRNTQELATYNELQLLEKLLNKLMEGPVAHSPLSVQEGMRRCGVSDYGGGSTYAPAETFLHQALHTSPWRSWPECPCSPNSCSGTGSDGPLQSNEKLNPKPSFRLSSAPLRTSSLPKLQMTSTVS